ncbi:MAG: glutaminyl-peptide cyclotransferase [Ferruginibacter sp.]
MKIIPVLLTGLMFFAGCSSNDNGTEPTPGPATPISGIAAPKIISLTIRGIYTHDTSAYTQGLEIYKGKMYESTGDYVNSSVRITDVKTGEVERKHMMGTDKVFGEGITIFNDKIYQLTWKNHLVNVYDIGNLDKPLRTFTWPYEGWGITHNQTDLIISDGTANLYFVNPEDFKLKSTIQVTDNNGPMTALNELEYIDGYIFANVYGGDFILKIDPANGHVVGRIDLPDLITKYAKGYSPDSEEVLNGIAWDSATKMVYITGKRWPKMFEATIN